MSKEVTALFIQRGLFLTIMMVCLGFYSSAFGQNASIRQGFLELFRNDGTNELDKTRWPGD